jgi:hypothetical protein
MLVELIQNTSLRSVKGFRSTNTEQSFTRMRRGASVIRKSFCPYLQSYRRCPARIQSVYYLKYPGSLWHHECILNCNLMESLDLGWEWSTWPPAHCNLLQIALSTSLFTKRAISQNNCPFLMILNFT